MKRVIQVFLLFLFCSCQPTKKCNNFSCEPTSNKKKKEVFFKKNKIKKKHKKPKQGLFNKKMYKQ